MCTSVVCDFADCRVHHGDFAIAALAQRLGSGAVLRAYPVLLKSKQLTFVRAWEMSRLISERAEYDWTKLIEGKLAAPPRGLTFRAIRGLEHPRVKRQQLQRHKPVWSTLSSELLRPLSEA